MCIIIFETPCCLAYVITIDVHLLQVQVYCYISNVGVRNYWGLYFVLYSPYWKVFQMETADHKGIIVLYCVFPFASQAVWAYGSLNLDYIRMEPMPITMAARSKAWTGFESHSRHGCLCVVLCVGSGLATGWSLIRGVYHVKILRNWRKGQGPTKDCRASDEWMNEIWDW
jgi:hypothetical protein